MTSRAACLSIVLLGGIGPIDCREAPTPRAAPRVKPADMATAPQPPKAPELPSDGQIMRDADHELAKWRAMDYRVRDLKITKEADQYEKDECNVVVVGKTGQGMVRVFMAYERRADFWKLKGRNSRIFPNDR